MSKISVMNYIKSQGRTCNQFFGKVSFIYPSFIQVKRLTDTKMFH